MSCCRFLYVSPSLISGLYPHPVCCKADAGPKGISAHVPPQGVNSQGQLQHLPSLPHAGGDGDVAPLVKASGSVQCPKSSDTMQQRGSPRWDFRVLSQNAKPPS